MAKMWNSSCGVKKEPKVKVSDKKVSEVSEDRSKSKTVSAKENKGEGLKKATITTKKVKNIK
jgi:hypothetical protein